MALAGFAQMDDFFGDGLVLPDKPKTETDPQEASNQQLDLLLDSAGNSSNASSPLFEGNLMDIDMAFDAP